MSAEFPSQDPLEAAKAVASDEYQRQQQEERDRQREEEARAAQERREEEARAAQNARLGEWLDGDQQNARDLEKYLESRPYEDAEGIHDPVSHKVIEPVDAGTFGRKERHQWGNRHFEMARRDRYDSTHENPADLADDQLFNRFITEEVEGNKTFLEDYGEVLADKLADKDISIVDLAEMHAEAEFEEVKTGKSADRAVSIITDAIEARIDDHEDDNKGTGRTYQVHDENGKIKTITAEEDEAIKTENFCKLIDRAYDRRLAQLHENNADLIARRDQDQADTDENARSGATDEGGKAPEEVSGDHEADQSEPEYDKSYEDESESEPATDVLPEDGSDDEDLELEEDEFFDGIPQDDNTNKKKRKFKLTVPKQGMREHPIKPEPMKPEGYKHPIDKFDEKYTLPIKAKINGKASQLNEKVKDAAGRASERSAFLRRAGRIGNTVMKRMVKIPGQWDELVISSYRSREAAMANLRPNLQSDHSDKLKPISGIPMINYDPHAKPAAPVEADENVHDQEAEPADPVVEEDDTDEYPVQPLSENNIPEVEEQEHGSYEPGSPEASAGPGKIRGQFRNVLGTLAIEMGLRKSEDEKRRDEVREKLDLKDDSRFKSKLIAALEGEAHLAGDTVEITDYLGSHQENGEITHYMEYKDAQGDRKITPLDQFIWTNLPLERRKELEKAGISPYDLTAGSDPILKSNS